MSDEDYMDAGGRTVLERLRFGVAAVAVPLLEFGLPEKSYATPPEMALGFAEKMLRCDSLEALCGLVYEDRKAAAAFASYSSGVLKFMESREGDLPAYPPGMAAHIVAAHALKWFFEEIDRQYPEGVITDEN